MRPVWGTCLPTFDSIPSAMIRIKRTELPQFPGDFSEVKHLSLSFHICRISNSILCLLAAFVEKLQMKSCIYLTTIY